MDDDLHRLSIDDSVVGRPTHACVVKLVGVFSCCYYLMVILYNNRCFYRHESGLLKIQRAKCQIAQNLAEQKVLLKLAFSASKKLSGILPPLTLQHGFYAVYWVSLAVSVVYWVSQQRNWGVCSQRWVHTAQDKKRHKETKRKHCRLEVMRNTLHSSQFKRLTLQILFTAVVARTDKKTHTAICTLYTAHNTSKRLSLVKKRCRWAFGLLDLHQSRVRHCLQVTSY